MKKFTCFLLLSMSLLIAIPQAKCQIVYGTGTAADPYQIWTANDLVQLKNEVNAGDNKSGKYYSIMKDIDMSSITNWLASGIFGGNLNGNHYVMTNFNGSSSLFRYLEGTGEIYNLIMKNAFIYSEQLNNTGAIACFSSGKIYNCHTEVTIKIAPHVDLLQRAQGHGGIVGLNQSGALIENCFSDFTLLTIFDRVGGIAGINDGTIKNCYATGSVKNPNRYFTGGITGQLGPDGTIKFCVNLMDTIIGNPNPYAGNISIGRVFGRYTSNGSGINNYSIETTLLNGTTVSGTTTDQNGASINLQQAQSQSFYESIGWNFVNVWKMSNPAGIYKGYPIFKAMQDEGATCFAGGDGTEENPYRITEAGHLDCLIDHASDPDNAGAHYRIMNDIDMLDYILENYPVVGWRGNELTEFNGYLHGGGHMIQGIWLNRPTATMAGGLFAGVGVDGTVDSLGIHIHDRGIIASGEVGGLVGYNDGVIFSCYTQSNIVKNTATYATGGLVGHNTGIMYDCYSTCNIISQGSAQGFTGGLVGLNDTKFANINTSYSTGNITNASLDLAGGLVGKNDRGYVKFCYFDKQTSAKTNAVGYTNSTANVKVDALTTAQMKNQDILVYFDFDENWKTITNSYPMLQWQKAESAPKRLLSEENTEDHGMVSETDNELAIYPNPTTGIVNINTEGDVNIKIYNLQGILLKETNRKSVDLSSFSEGVYIFNVNGKVKKIMKQ